MLMGNNGTIISEYRREMAAIIISENKIREIVMPCSTKKLRSAG